MQLIIHFVEFQTECENLGLETFYRTYVQRLQRSYLSIFFVMHTIIGMVHTIVLVATQVQLLKLIYISVPMRNGFIYSIRLFFCLAILDDSAN